MRRPPTITLCGSTRFKTEYERYNRWFTLNGCIVLSVGWFAHVDGPVPTHDQKARMDELHLRKIDLSDMVFVIDTGGYIGESTKREIEYAQATTKQVYYASNWEQMKKVTWEALERSRMSESQLCRCCGAVNKDAESWEVICPLCWDVKMWTAIRAIRLSQRITELEAENERLRESSVENFRKV